jgi:hypothetical protein
MRGLTKNTARADAHSDFGDISDPTLSVVRVAEKNAPENPSQAISG